MQSQKFFRGFPIDTKCLVWLACRQDTLKFYPTVLEIVIYFHHTTYDGVHAGDPSSSTFLSKKKKLFVFTWDPDTQHNIYLCTVRKAVKDLHWSSCVMSITRAGTDTD